MLDNALQHRIRGHTTNKMRRKKKHKIYMDKQKLVNDTVWVQEWSRGKGVVSDLLLFVAANCVHCIIKY